MAARAGGKERLLGGARAARMVRRLRAADLACTGGGPAWRWRRGA